MYNVDMYLRYVALEDLVCGELLQWRYYRRVDCREVRENLLLVAALDGFC